jgi:hypothetical protein
MLAPIRRRFTIADGMIFVAGAALAVMLTHEYDTSFYVVWKRVSADRLLILVQGSSQCVAAAFMLALIPIRLLRPRPGLRRLVRQPGFAACCAIAAVLVLGFIEGLMWVVFRDVQKGQGDSWPFQQLWEIGVGYRGPFVVAGAWLLLALTGRWRAEKSWVDRLGRALGAVWVVWLPIHLLEPWLLRYLPAI